MKELSLKKQALITAGSSALMRALGFGIRLWISRILGAEALGVMELLARLFSAFLSIHLKSYALAAGGDAIAWLTAGLLAFFLYLVVWKREVRKFQRT